MPEWIEPVLNYEIIGIAAQRYLIAFAVLLAAFLMRKIVQGLLEKRFAKLAEKTKTKLDDRLLQALSKPVSLAILLGGVLCAILILGLPGDVEVIILNVAKVLFAALGTWLVFRLIDVFADYSASLAGKTDTKLDDQLVPLVRKTAKIFIGVVAFVLVVQNLGYSVSGLLAGLGLGGLAFALAAKDTIANLFGSATIFADRPFQVGDWINTDKVEGVVEEVGFRSTKIRTFAKTLVIIPNSVLANMAIDNFSAMPKRRIKMTVGVTYDTTANQMEQAVEAIKKILREHEGIDQDFFLVSFTDFGPSSLDILVYCFTKTTAWEEYLKVRQEVNLAIMRALEKMGLSIAFPTRTVYLHKE
jgi:MscS family membrane protein